MARLARLDFAGIAQHDVQRGNDRQPWFAEALDPWKPPTNAPTPDNNASGAATACAPRSKPSVGSPTDTELGTQRKSLAPGHGANDAGSWTFPRAALCLSDLRGYARRQQPSSCGCVQERGEVDA